MSSTGKLNRLPSLAPPRGAAISGVIFGVLAIVGLGLVRYAIPASARESGTWLLEPRHREAVLLALRLVPFSGIAFLWFMGVLRSVMGDWEDRLFATVFIGSGLLFVASMFGSAAATESVIESIAAGGIRGDAYYFGRSLSDILMNLFAMKMAGVFIFSTCTIGLRTRIFPRWIALIGYGCGSLLLLIIANWRWIALVFPGWMLLLSSQILLTELSLAQGVPEKRRLG